MNELKPSYRLLSVVRVKELLTTDDPEYGKDFTEAEWAVITERLEALARLIWKISGRKAREEQGQMVRPLGGRGPARETASPGMLERK
jgi:hypothetical protein